MAYGFSTIRPRTSDTSTIEEFCHRRTRSDDVFRRKLKFNDDHRSKLSEVNDQQDCNFKRVFPSEDLNVPPENNENNVGHIKQKKASTKRDKVTSPKNMDSEIIQPTIHPRYKTRTSSAGTLIISEESFNKPNRRKRPERKNTTADMTSGKIAEESNIRSTSSCIEMTRNDANFSNKQISRTADTIRRRSTINSCAYRISYPPSDDENNSFKSVVSHARQKSDPVDYTLNSITSTSAIRQGHWDDRNTENASRRLAPKRRSYNVFQNKPKTEQTSAVLPDKFENHQHRKKKRRHVRRHRQHSAESTSSNSDSEEFQVQQKLTACVKHKQPHTSEHSASLFGPDLAVHNGGASAADLLDLVRHLSSQADRHVTPMGANVSRHSSKGLSGRRSQSSGSICNGKGRSSEGKSCGSLPSYLDDRASEGYNNNHDCEKENRNEVPRIPPLGDGAPLHWKFSDTQTALCDQGYGSERSPEEEYPPPLPEHDNQCHHHEQYHLEPHACYPFITPESTFLVKLNKGSRGLGLSVTGGIDSGGSWPGLIRIKRLFPHQPASQCGLINVGDLLLEANGITLTGLTNYEALEVLRTASNQVELRICRPPPDVLTCVSPISEVPPPPPRREAIGGPSTPPLGFNSPEDDYYHGEFEIIIMKIQGSLGFTLRKEDDSALGHYVRALVREPALTDGRIKAGDKIIAVNDVEISPMSHEQAVQFLRQCDEEVKLRLYRDAAQTPVAALSPTETTPRTSFSRKSNLRQEAVDMLNDIAVRKLIPGHDEGNGPDEGRANDSFGQGPASMPHITLENSSAGFSYKNPAYQTAHPPCVTDHEELPPAPIKPAAPKPRGDEGSKIRKWKGAILEDVEESNQKTADLVKLREENEILAIELNRGWNSRLGFSLQGAAGVTYVSAVYANSVAARDGRLKPGDRLLRVNDESVEHLSTSEIIDLLRIVRGAVCIVVSRTNAKEDCLKSNAVN